MLSSAQDQHQIEYVTTYNCSPHPAAQGSSPAPPQVKAAMNMGRGGTHCLCPGQITDDTELAMCLAAALVEGKGKLDAHAIAKWYCTWMCGDIGPFDCGNTCGAAFYSCRRFLDKPSSEHAACDWSGQVLVKGAHYTTVEHTHSPRGSTTDASSCRQTEPAVQSKRQCHEVWGARHTQSAPFTPITDHLATQRVGCTTDVLLWQCGAID